MAIICDTITAPIFWASHLVNGDSSGMIEEDMKDCAKFEKYLETENWRVVGIVEDSERFTWNGHLYFSSTQGITVCDYEIFRESA